MDVIYYNRERNVTAELQLGVEPCTRQELFERSHVISLHRPGPAPGQPPEVGREELEVAREAVILINTAHPDLVDPNALLWAAHTKSVRGAFDGVSAGSAWQHLLALGPERFLAVPAMGFNTAEANLRASRWAAEAVCDVLDGDSHHLVSNPDFRSVRRTARP
ncbi:NAD(P)-dependent oxidoreductase [Streptomyces sp. JNUCC 63]